MNLQIGEIDAAVLVAYLVAMVLFGLWVGRGQRDLTDYLLGGRGLPWGLVLLSIVATETSTVTFLSVPGMAFAKDGCLVFLQLAMGLIVGRLMVVFLLLPHYFRGELFTAYEALEHRFGSATKQTASLLFLVTRNLADGLRLYLTAIVLTHVVGVDLSICVVLIGLVTILYTMIGGMKAVAWNDCIQFAVYIGGALLAGGVILHQLPGGWSQVADYAAEHGKFRMFDFSADLSTDYTFWSGLIGGAFLALATHGSDQLMVQRYLAAGTRRKAGWALALSGPVVFAQFALFLMLGVALACYYSVNDPAVPFEGDDHVFAQFIVHRMPPVAVGITLAAVFSAAMSTLSSSLNASAAAAVNDIYLPRCKQKPSNEHLLRASRGLTVVFGLVQISVGMAGYYFQQSVVTSVLTVAGYTFGPVLGLFFLNALPWRVPQRAAQAGLIGGLALVTHVWLRTTIAWPWYSIIGSLSTVVIAVVVDLTLCDRPDEEGDDPPAH